MAFDGIVTYSIKEELNTLLSGGKIDKVNQPEEDELLLHIRSNSTNYKLLLSANTANPRIYLTERYKKENPLSAPSFCMLMRKHLQGSRIIEVFQPSLERIIEIKVETLDDMKVKRNRSLIIEIMGKHSNIILIDTDENKIIDSIKRIPITVSSVREVLPGKTYSYPPSQDKLNPMNEISINEFNSVLASKNDKLFKAIYTSFLGLSPSMGREIALRSNISPETPFELLSSVEISKLHEVFTRLFRQVSSGIFHPCVSLDRRINKILDFSCIKLLQFQEYSYLEFESISKATESYYEEKDSSERIKQRSSDLRKSLNTKLDRFLNKLQKQKEEYLAAQELDLFKKFGELLTSYVYMLEKGMESIEVEDFYDESLPKVIIPLKKNLTPSENIQSYFKKYNKMKNTILELEKHIKETEDEVNYLENVLLSINTCENLKDLEEITEELKTEGYVRKKGKEKKTSSKNQKSDSLDFMTFTSRDNIAIYVGKNNKQNEFLTLKFASAKDIWLHTKDIPGSHVIIKSDGIDVPLTTLEDAAILAAYYSKARLSSKVPVDYTEKKNIKKPKGSKPGMVIYETNSTVYVDPSEERVSSLRQRENPLT